MYSKARIAGHPIHPMLVSFPIALFTATIALELAYLGTHDAFFYRAAMIANIAGVVMGLVAAIPGAIDRYFLPRASRAKDLANQHALFNLLAIGLYGVSAALLYIGWNDRVMVDGAYVLNPTIPLAFDMVGFVSLVTAGMLGWSLVQTHHVGIKPANVRAHRPSREPELETNPLMALRTH
jgi:uncharacterized membrane protein